MLIELLELIYKGKIYIFPGVGDAFSWVSESPSLYLVNTYAHPCIVKKNPEIFYDNSCTLEFHSFSQ